MSEEYQKIALKPIHSVDLGNTVCKFGFFVALSASITIGSFTYDKVNLKDLIEGINKETDNSTSSVNIINFMSRLNIDIEHEVNEEGTLLKTYYELNTLKQNW
jgi:hypothetical protein